MKTQITDVVVTRMPPLQRLQKTFKRLNLSWQVIETTARVVSPTERAGFIATLAHTRAAFNQIAQEMLAQISATYWENAQRDLRSKAQVAIDILVRNLFERTADVGFVATDGPLVDFISAPSAEKRGALLDRLRAYQSKYTVYQDIVLLDTDAQVLLSLQDHKRRPGSLPDWWPNLRNSGSYVEYFGPDVGAVQGTRILQYAHAVVDANGQWCGAVLLQFNLDSEVRSIFEALRGPTDPTILLFLDRNQRVIASSHPLHFAPQTVLDIEAEAEEKRLPVVRRTGAEFLRVACQSHGYQGYGGPGWTAMALIPLDQAFGASNTAAESQVSSGAHPIGNGPQGVNPAEAQQAFRMAADNAALQAIVARARSIETDLGRVIWNGKLADSSMDSGASMHPVFAEIGRTSQQTLQVFDRAIHDLRELLMQGKRAELAAHAALAVNILDRNLYERANDCRWWALSAELAQQLEILNRAPDAATRQRAERVLAHLNSLYTVYRRIALFDANGTVVAVSRDADSLPPGLQLPKALVEQTCALQGSQSYAVSAMQPSPLTDGAATYLYCAPIRLNPLARPIGGIALAFNCATELQAMLVDAEPADQAITSVFLGPDGRVLSATDVSLTVGECAPFYAELAAGLSALAASATATASTASAAHDRTVFVEWNDRHYLAGVARSSGYREFKVTDGYRDDVLGVLLTPVDPPPTAPAAVKLPHLPAALVRDTHYYGVVQCGNLYLGLSGRQVLEAVEVSAIAAAPAGSSLAGIYPMGNGPGARILPVFDTPALLGQQPFGRLHSCAAAPDGVAVIVRTASNPIVLLVNRLVDVITCDQLAPPPGGENADAPWIAGLIHDASASAVPVLALNPDGISQPDFAQAVEQA